MTEIRVLKYDDGGWCEQSYEGDMLHGNWTVYFPNGDKSWERQYVRGLKQGYCRKWNQQKQLIEEELYHLDKLHGCWRQWDDEGNERIVGTFHFGYELDVLEESENRDFREVIRPFLALEPGDFAVLLPQILPRMRRKSLLMKKGEQTLPTESRRGSYWNYVNVLGSNETWPHHNGKPLFPILQIQCDDARSADSPLAGFKFVTLFSIADDIPISLGEDIVVRAYRDGDELVSTTPPLSPLEAPCDMLLTEEIASYPDENDLPPGLRVHLRSTGNQQPVLDQPERFSSRVGGWPGWLQWGRVAHYGQFAFQVDRLDIEDWHCGNSAVNYFFWQDERNEFSWRHERL